MEKYTNIESAFEDKLSEYDVDKVKKLKTIKVWIFKSTNDPEEKYFFIVNNLHNSNYREKIRGRLINGFKFVEEIDTEEKLEYDNEKNLTFDSIIKLMTKNKELSSQYRKFI